MSGREEDVEAEVGGEGEGGECEEPGGGGEVEGEDVRGV